MLFFVILFFFFNGAATTDIYTLSLHDALPIYLVGARPRARVVLELGQPRLPGRRRPGELRRAGHRPNRSEEHTSELQSHSDLVCRLLLEKKKKTVLSYEGR